MKKLQNVAEYKGYNAKIEFNADEMVLHGKIEGIDDLVTFESSDTEKIIDEFHAAVDDYLIFCDEIGKAPSKSYKGSFNVRITPELHKQLACVAEVNSESLNSCVEKAISLYLESISLQNAYARLSTNSSTQITAIYNYDFDNKDMISG